VRLPATFVIFLKGLLMGMADIIPGVSGGTMALITNIYERLIRAIRDIDFRFVFYFFKGDFKAARGNFRSIDLALLLPLGAGIITAFLILARILGFMLDNYPAYVFAFFFGLILASAGIISNYVERLDMRHILSITIGFVLVFFIVGLDEVSNNHSPPVICFSGALAICAMILPGISGALILMIVGQYEYLLDTLNAFLDTHDPKYLLDIGLFLGGAALGLISFSRLLDYMISRHRSITMSFLFGLMLGALRVPAEEVWDNTGSSGTLELAGVVMAALAGIFMIIFIQKKSMAVESLTSEQKNGGQQNVIQ